MDFIYSTCRFYVPIAIQLIGNKFATAEIEVIVYGYVILYIVYWKLVVVILDNIIHARPPPPEETKLAVTMGAVENVIP
jgi:hypothetical protein